MSLEAAIFDILTHASAVTAIVGKQVYPLGIPQGKTGAAVVFQQIASDVPHATSGDETLRTESVQITCWSSAGASGSPDQARTLAEAVRTALSAASGSHGGSIIHYCSIDTEADAIDIEDNEDLTRYGKRQDWEIVCE